MKFIVEKLGPQKLMTYESTFFPDRKTPAAIKIQNLEAAQCSIAHFLIDNSTAPILQY